MDLRSYHITLIFNKGIILFSLTIHFDIYFLGSKVIMIKIVLYYQK